MSEDQSLLPMLEELLSAVKAQISFKILLLLLEDMPIALWIKDFTDPERPSMVYLNAACCELYEIPATDWLGKTDREVFPQISAYWHESDLAALHGASPVFFAQHETAGADRYSHVYKWRMTVNGNVFVAGMTVPEATRRDDLNRGN